MCPAAKEPQNLFFSPALFEILKKKLLRAGLNDWTEVLVGWQPSLLYWVRDGGTASFTGPRNISWFCFIIQSLEISQSFVLCALWKKHRKQVRETVDYFTLGNLLQSWISSWGCLQGITYLFVKCFSLRVSSSLVLWRNYREVVNIGKPLFLFYYMRKAQVRKWKGVGGLVTTVSTWIGQSGPDKFQKDVFEANLQC